MFNDQEKLDLEYVNWNRSCTFETHGKYLSSTEEKPA